MKSYPHFTAIEAEFSYLSSISFISSIVNSFGVAYGSCLNGLGATNSHPPFSTERVKFLPT